MKIRIFIALSLLCVSFSAFASRKGIVYDGWNPLSACTVQCGATAGTLTDTSAVLNLDGGYSLNFGVNPSLPSGCSAAGGCAGILAAYVGGSTNPNQYWLAWGAPSSSGTPCCSPIYEEIFVTPVSSTEFTVSFAFDPVLDTGYKNEFTSFSFSGPGGSGSFAATDLYDSPQITGTSSPLDSLIDFDIKNGQVVSMSSGWQAVAAPEIDLRSSSSLNELTLLAGCLVVLGARRRLSAVRGR
jgi:hypothetical protein